MTKCDEALKRLYEYLDRELSSEELVEVQRHLDACPPCRDRFTFEADVLRLVRKSCRDVSAPPELVERVKRICSQERQTR
ncbi:MAG TPA: mycothiol system anti-sigma-R factor [Thermomicrobiaceae bacterium]|nr:mycothiol system anti-sigma-R factor [Thermomicrobiaceae bacterium]HEX5370252.1 mycothiol system anti-sigma-R factor [Dehalococcoidia bacterium]